MKNVYDQMFDLKIYGNFSLIESFNLPIGLRNYYTEKLIKKLEDEKKEMDKINKHK